MKDGEMSNAQANFKFFLWNKEAESIKSHELFARLRELKLPDEITSRFLDLLQKAIKVSGKVLQIGKIVVIKVLEFVEAHPALVVGLGIGVVLGGAIAGLLASIHIPWILGFLKPILTPILATIGSFFQITLPLGGAILGNQLDKVVPGMGKSVAEVAKEFFKLFADVLDAAFGNLRGDAFQMA